MIQGNSTQLTLTPEQSGLYGVELQVSAQTAAGLIIDRAAVAVFEAQPVVAPGLLPVDGALPMALVLGFLLLPILVLLLLPILILLLLF